MNKEQNVSWLISTVANPQWVTDCLLGSCSVNLFVALLLLHLMLTVIAQQYDNAFKVQLSVFFSLLHFNNMLFHV